MPDKKMLRKGMRERRNALSSAEIREKSAVITNKILRSKEFINAKSVFTYISMQSEVATRDLIRAAWLAGKKVAVPVVLPGTPDMRFIDINNFDDLTKSPFGVPEPSPDGEQAFADKNTLLIVPGLVFDKKNYRIGYGGGYYDRFMAKNETMGTVGVCYDFQIIEDVFPESWDIAVDRIVTEIR